MTQISYYTEEGLEKLNDELKRLKSVERFSASKQIAEARDKGDLSENAEYAAAKEALALLELKISKLEELILYARIVDESKLDNSKVLILSTVIIQNTESSVSMTYSIVPETEANPKEGKISVDSPIGKGLLGKKEGEFAEINTPNGKMKFKILQISR